MKHITKALFASALAMALSASTYAQAGGSAGGLPTPGVGAGSMKAPTETGYGSPDVTGSGDRSARSNPATERSDSGNVNSGPGGSRGNGQ
ncbi:hypothetical protein [Paraburkholderia sp. RL17-373-BIF-A]|uniref:hypothetical protein n=1 Tax=Paraburkholderia sp. RL17-373-BIF-A TaxID=3031629 RepID=UPI0038BA87CD